jgi:hypothetical protein
LSDCLFVGTDLLLIPEETLLIINSELALTRISVGLLLCDLLQLHFVNFVRSIESSVCQLNLPLLFKCAHVPLVDEDLFVAH